MGLYLKFWGEIKESKNLLCANIKANLYRFLLEEMTEKMNKQQSAHHVHIDRFISHFFRLQSIKLGAKLEHRQAV